MLVPEPDVAVVFVILTPATLPVRALATSATPFCSISSEPTVVTA